MSLKMRSYIGESISGRLSLNRDFVFVISFLSFQIVIFFIINRKIRANLPVTAAMNGKAGTATKSKVRDAESKTYSIQYVYIRERFACANGLPDVQINRRIIIKYILWALL